ncbi:hypothetical protein AAFF_G00073110 [Aldrovandia affinis]|uniref:Uncharacterized protein n=1 Tax=Aldrovandia affinis TaxID=143900 RepID=A0AAD7WD41_9TELE|nr:hypothetical protein AAFF_G00073110 [Aldrovandia affinis]
MRLAFGHTILLGVAVETSARFLLALAFLRWQVRPLYVGPPLLPAQVWRDARSDSGQGGGGGRPPVRFWWSGDRANGGTCERRGEGGRADPFCRRLSAAGGHVFLVAVSRL